LELTLRIDRTAPKVRRWKDDQRCSEPRVACSYKSPIRPFPAPTDESIGILDLQNCFAEFFAPSNLELHHLVDFFGRNRKTH
jgi:hypothetical protein